MQNKRKFHSSTARLGKKKSAYVVVLHLDERLGFVAAHGGLHCKATGIGEAGSLGMRRHETAAGKREGGGEKKT